MNFYWEIHTGMRTKVKLTDIKKTLVKKAPGGYVCTYHMQ